MRRKAIFIISGIIVIIVITAVFVFYFNQQTTTKTVAKPKDDSSNYYIEKGAEPYAKIIKPAVESYLNQDISESIASRNKRLVAYFSSDSPILSRDIEIRSDNSTIRTTASVTSVSFPDGGQSSPTLIIKADVTNYVGTNKSSSSKSYWATLKQNSDGSYVVYDVGKMEQ